MIVPGLWNDSGCAAALGCCVMGLGMVFGWRSSEVVLGLWVLDEGCGGLGVVVIGVSGTGRLRITSHEE